MLCILYVHPVTNKCAVDPDLAISTFHTSTRQSWDSLDGVNLSQKLSEQRWREKNPIKPALLGDQAWEFSPWVFDFFIKHRKIGQYSRSWECILFHTVIRNQVLWLPGRRSELSPTILPCFCSALGRGSSINLSRPKAAVGTGSYPVRALNHLVFHSVY